MQTDTATPRNKTEPYRVPDNPLEFYRLPRVRKICGDVAASTVWAWSKNYKETGFPRPVKLTNSCTVWIASEIEAWAQARIAESRKAA